MLIKREKIVAGNWKMNLDRQKSIALAESIATQHADASSVTIVLCPPNVYIEAVGAAIGIAQGKNASRLALGAQNMHELANGAFTGEVAAAMLVDCGCRYVILGHSERRTLYAETNATVNAKTNHRFAFRATSSRFHPNHCCLRTRLGHRYRSSGNSPTGARSARFDPRVARNDVVCGYRWAGADCVWRQRQAGQCKRFGFPARY